METAHRRASAESVRYVPYQFGDVAVDVNVMKVKTQTDVGAGEVRKLPSCSANLKWRVQASQMEKVPVTFAHASSSVCICRSGNNGHQGLS